MGKTWKDRPQLDRPVTQDDILLLSDTTDGGIIKWIKASLFRGPGVKKIKKTASEGLTDTYTFFYDDGSKFDFIINNGDRGIPKAWMGEWNANINYPAEVGVEYEGSSYFTLKECIGIKPTNKEYYGLLALAGKDGENGKDGSVEDCLMLRDYDPSKRREQVAFESDLEKTNKNLAENYYKKDEVWNNNETYNKEETIEVINDATNKLRNSVGNLYYGSSGGLIISTGNFSIPNILGHTNFKKLIFTFFWGDSKGYIYGTGEYDIQTNSNKCNYYRGSRAITTSIYNCIDLETGSGVSPEESRIKAKVVSVDNSNINFSGVNTIDKGPILYEMKYIL